MAASSQASLSSSSSRWKLPEELIALSKGDEWPAVLREWRLDYIEMLERGEDSETCLCHHHPIREVCHIVNDENGNRAIVGNCCVERFEPDDQRFAGMGKVFDAFKRILGNQEASANKELIEYAFSKGIINEVDRGFYLKNWRKRALSERQMSWKCSLNRRMIARIAPWGVPAEPARRIAAMVPLVLASRAEVEAAELFRGRFASQAFGTERERGVAARLTVVAGRTLPESLQTLRAAPTQLADPVLEAEAQRRGYLRGQDHEFYHSMLLRAGSVPSNRQQAWISDINCRILAGRYI